MKTDLNKLCEVVAVTGIIVMLGAGCATTEKVNNLFSQWGEENQRQDQALGVRVFDKDFDAVFSAAIKGLSDAGFVVKNMDRQSGYILAEGPCPIPENQRYTLAKAMCDEIRKKAYTKWNPNPGNFTEDATINLDRLGDHKTKLTMRLFTPPRTDNNSFHYEQYPPLLEAMYQCMWPPLEKEISPDENPDNKKK